MDRTLTSLFALYVLTPGRRIYALRRVLERATEMGHEALLGPIAAAIAHDYHAIDLDVARRMRSRGTVRERHAAFARTLGAIISLLAYYGRDDSTAAALQSTLLPRGLFHHIHLAHAEQLAANERVLSILEDAGRKAWLDAHGIRPLIEQLRIEHDAFAAALQARDSSKRPTWKQVRAARAHGQELYLQVVARIVVMFADDVDTRNALLDPIYQQNQRIKDYRRQRRSVAEVDPESGELLDDAKAPAASEPSSA